ncbi:hypothetical protein GCM10023149_37330 [Mucilaginibacter gynuensis]|uniref:SusD-like starch-binding protein associating with outer membrane n=1 Tax=Mucilaginibacter gynuensis TaxID=1302236 RepID=A0ABP8GXU5_9SPHI
MEKKPNQALTVPTTLTDLRTLLDNNDDLNQAPYLTTTCTDDIYTTKDGLLAAGSIVSNSYLWEKDVYEGQPQADWNRPYQQVFYANVVLEGLEKLTGPDKGTAEFLNLQGSALFIRALAFYHLAQEFALPFDPATASLTPGIPLRLATDVNVRSKRGTLLQTYTQIVKDLEAAKDLLPLSAAFKTRPTKPAALALLARVLQTMQIYDQAAEAATKCLKSNGSLIDYNTLDVSAYRAFPRAIPNGNVEVLYFTPLINVDFLDFPTLTAIDSTLYRSYDEHDLRKTLFFRQWDGYVTFKGNYSGNAAVFGGLATDEVYLIRAECYARMGNITLAMKDLNELLKNRIIKTAFSPLKAANVEEALMLILAERRKELVFRNTRWTDLRRLNQDSRFAVTLLRHIDGQEYRLPPGDRRYTFPIPDDEIRNSGIEQNPR